MARQRRASKRKARHHAPDTHQQQPQSENRQRVASVLSQSPLDLVELRAVASFGFTNDERLIAWPTLLCLPSNVDSKKYYADAVNAIKQHAYTDQIQKDINRSFNHFTVHGVAFTDAEKKTHRAALSRIINACICKHPSLHYIQGYHDICAVFYLICGEELGFRLVERASLSFFRDVLSSSLDVVMHALSYIYLLLSTFDPEVHQLLAEAELPPFFALSWFMTWFSHDFNALNSIARMFDFFLSSHPLMPVYTSCAAIHLMRGELLALRGADGLEIGPVHAFFREINEHKISIPKLIDTSLQLFQQTPPSALLKMSSVPTAFGTSSPYLVPHVSHLFPTSLRARIGRAVRRLAFSAVATAAAAGALYYFEAIPLLEIPLSMVPLL